MSQAVLERATLAQALKVIPDLKPFISKQQLSAIRQFMTDEEVGQHYIDKVMEIYQTIASMPVTYQQESKGDDAIVYLHYFIGQCDFWISEKDKLGDGTFQSYGLVSLYGDVRSAEFGYVDLHDVIQNNAELDLYWKPKSFAQIRAERS